MSIEFSAPAGSSGTMRNSVVPTSADAADPEVSDRKLRLGLVVNPIAGIGGSVALKGSDGIVVQELARQRGGTYKAPHRLQRFLIALGAATSKLCFVTWGGAMGESLLSGRVEHVEVVGQPANPTSAADTRSAGKGIGDVDLMLFVGGDGTARDLLDVLTPGQLVLGIPAGVKMQSGVFALTPEAAAEVVLRLLDGRLVASSIGEVRDIDEAALRQGQINSRYYGEMRVPQAGDYVQQTKVGGQENEDLAVLEIVQDTLERLEATVQPVILGPGSTLLAVKQALGLDAELLGVDVWQAGQQLGKDVTAADLEELDLTAALLVVSFSRQQGFLFGRGNQQISAQVLGRLPKKNIWVLGTRTKLKSLEGRPLKVDSGSPELDQALAGLIEVTAGYDDRLLYRMGLND